MNWRPPDTGPHFSDPSKLYRTGSDDSIVPVLLLLFNQGKITKRNTYIIIIRNNNDILRFFVVAISFSLHAMLPLLANKG